MYNINRLLISALLPDFSDQLFELQINAGFLELETRFLAIFYYPKPGFYSITKPGCFKNIELLLHSNIRNSDNTEIVEWGV